jgi:hypothetical protein
VLACLECLTVLSSQDDDVEMSEEDNNDDSKEAISRNTRELLLKIIEARGPLHQINSATSGTFGFITTSLDNARSLPGKPSIAGLDLAKSQRDKAIFEVRKVATELMEGIRKLDPLVKEVARDNEFLRRYNEYLRQCTAGGADLQAQLEEIQQRAAEEEEKARAQAQAHRENLQGRGSKRRRTDRGYQESGLFD